ncbi:MAG: type II toxin-antitoxin system VapC family toxin [Bryobacteraceae bacterium]
MIVDSSAIFAILFGEPEAERFARAIAGAAARRMSAVNWLEVLIVSESRLGPDGGNDGQLLMSELQIQQAPFGARELLEAALVWRRFGKGRHPAGLNLGDCCAYATASRWQEPLLFKGDDFGRTDVVAAEW